MHRSSDFTYFFKYFFPFLFVVIVPYELSILWKADIQLAIMNIIVFVYLVYFLIQLIVRLKKVETTEEGIIVRTFRSKKVVKYEDIIWISRFDPYFPLYPTIKYHDRKKGGTSKLSFMPPTQYRSAFRLDEMSVYLKEKVEAIKGYPADDHPPTLKDLWG